jgi:hypothetical protein
MVFRLGYGGTRQAQANQNRITDIPQHFSPLPLGRLLSDLAQMVKQEYGRDMTGK